MFVLRCVLCRNFYWIQSICSKLLCREPVCNVWLYYACSYNTTAISLIYSQSHINAVLHAWNCDGFPTTTRIRRSTFSSTTVATRMTRTEHHLHKLKAWLDITGLLFKHPLTTRGWLDVWRERGRGGRGRHACTTFGGACWSWYVLLYHGVRVKVDLKALKQSINYWILYTVVTCMRVCYQTSCYRLYIHVQ